MQRYIEFLIYVLVAYASWWRWGLRAMAPYFLCQGVWALLEISRAVNHQTYILRDAIHPPYGYGAVGSKGEPKP